MARLTSKFHKMICSACEEIGGPNCNPAAWDYRLEGEDGAMVHRDFLCDWHKSLVESFVIECPSEMLRRCEFVGLM